MSQVTWISVFCMCIAIIECSDKHAKRLLLNDPDVVEKRFNQLELEIQNLKSEVVSLKTESQQKTARISQLEAGQSSSGSFYTRWGRKSCPGNGTELIYTVNIYCISAGAWYDYAGSAVDFLCLPHDPDVIQSDLRKSVTAKHASSTLMIPGKTTCSGSLKLEYNGRLASGHYSYKGNSQYVCMDMNPEVLENGSANDNGKLFVGVQTKCGSLRCPPYQDNVMVPCVVCSG
ncbi:unnamed protein product [Mytilus edulis]|uniref:Uncharacterized protein n=1 Tax=Mytilus edulis TaxID=6550 RepID=A0A8S3R9U6_MYTED|nr:unnamed protein product [Mytilus edulis]